VFVTNGDLQSSMVPGGTSKCLEKELLNKIVFKCLIYKVL